MHYVAQSYDSEATALNVNKFELNQQLICSHTLDTGKAQFENKITSHTSACLLNYNVATL